MSGVFGPRRRSGLFAGILCAAAVMAGAARADTFEVKVDQARVMKLPDRVATIIIGNPLIADAALQAGGILVITGKGYGSTNMLALDRGGKVIMDRTVQVRAPGDAGLVTVYKGVARESYSCAPECAARITLGDSKDFFNDALAQGNARTGGAQANARAAARPQPRTKASKRAPRMVSGGLTRFRSSRQCRQEFNNADLLCVLMPRQP